ncbi:aminoglycoside phosphotransferase [Mycobacterium lentiflavum]|uniref:Aminoglycoside phosphotransferase n=1 Tax=Mycobacterium lentiflavum TaxID=141349 RepID=A0A0E4CQ90_MYCLN|nr:phosphotransferase [Mycobacterium lentiflavum]CQD20159.1 aminoglycoside phosphotransferase [Mycobacterium lentiflavum]
MEAVLADSTLDLTPAWFTAALREGGAIGPHTEVVAADAALFGTGQFGLVARAELKYDDNASGAPASVIVKLPSADQGSRELGIAIGAYEAEVRFYLEIAPRSGIDVPRSHWASFEPGTGRVTLLLEDLTDGWEVGDALAGGTVAQTEAALDQIARLHGDLWDDPSLRGLDWLGPIDRTQLLFDGVPAALPRFRERFGDRLERHQLKAVERLAPKGAEYPRAAWRGPLVVSHGDFRLDNVLFAQDSGTLRAKVIDWQSLRLAPPMIDAAIWLASCLSPDERRTHQDALLHRYHEGLLAAGVRDFGFTDCLASLRICSLYVFLLSVGISVTIAQSDRGDEMFAGMVARAADFVTDLGAETVLD